MKESLIEILQKKYDHFCDQCGINKDSHYIESLADYLLANSVIVPPVKVGDTMWILSKDLSTIQSVVITDIYCRWHNMGVSILDFLRKS